MNRNEGTFDRALRIIVGLVLVAVVFIGPKSSWAGVVGLVLLITGFFGYCPIYRVFGLRTRRTA